MLINLSEILSVPGKVVETTCNLEAETIAFMGSDYKILDAEPISIKISNTGKKSVMVVLDTKLSLVGQCSRCLADVTNSYTVHLERDIDMEPADTDQLDDYDELSYIKDCSLDVDDLLFNELYSMIPLSLLCKDDCLGLCKVCGNNRNIQPCDCRQTLPDPRMAVFGDIFNQLKEV